jgi:hypothetical protein
VKGNEPDTTKVHFGILTEVEVVTEMIGTEMMMIAEIVTDIHSEV